MPKEAAATPKKAPAKTGRKVSAYNQFIKSELAKVKAANPDLPHKEAFKKAASNWKASPQNPINKK